MLELVQLCFADEDKPETVLRLAYGLVGDLADTFPAGQIKQYLLTEWLAQSLRSKARVSGETKKTLRWAREVSLLRSGWSCDVQMLTDILQMVKRATA